MFYLKKKVRSYPVLPYLEQLWNYQKQVFKK